MSAEIRNWLRDMKSQAGSLPANVVPPEFVPALSIEELMGVTPDTSVPVVEFEPGQLDNAVAKARTEQELEHAEWLTKLDEVKLTPEQALAQCTEMGDAQYQAYMAELQQSDPTFCDAVLALVAASRAEAVPPIEPTAVVAEQVSPAPEAEKPQNALVVEPVIVTETVPAAKPAAAPATTKKSTKASNQKAKK